MEQELRPGPDHRGVRLDPHMALVARPKQPDARRGEGGYAVEPTPSGDGLRRGGIEVGRAVPAVPQSADGSGRHGAADLPSAHPESAQVSGRPHARHAAMVATRPGPRTRRRRICGLAEPSSAWAGGEVGDWCVPVLGGTSGTWRCGVTRRWFLRGSACWSGCWSACRPAREGPGVPGRGSGARPWRAGRRVPPGSGGQSQRTVGVSALMSTDGRPRLGPKSTLQLPVAPFFVQVPATVTPPRNSPCARVGLS